MLTRLWILWQNGPYKNKHKEQHKHQDAIDIQINYFFISSILLSFFCGIYNFLNDLSTKCWVTASVRSMTFIRGLNQFSAITTLHLLKNIVYSQCLLRLGCCCCCFCVDLLLCLFLYGTFVMLPLNLPLSTLLQQFLFELLFNLYNILTKQCSRHRNNTNVLVNCFFV